MTYENDYFDIPEDVKLMDDKQLHEEAEEAYADMEQHPVIHKKKPLKTLEFKYDKIVFSLGVKNGRNSL